MQPFAPCILALASLAHHQSCRGKRLNATGLPRFSQHHDSRLNSSPSFRQRQKMCKVDNNNKASALVILGMPTLESCPWRQAWRLEVRTSRAFQHNTAGAHCWHATSSMMLASLAASCGYILFSQTSNEFVFMLLACFLPLQSLGYKCTLGPDRPVSDG